AVHIMLMNLYWAAGASGKQAATAERAVALARALGDDRELVWVELMRGMAFVVLGRLHDGVRLLEEALHQVEELHAVEYIVMVVSLLAEAYACLGSFAQIYHYSAQGREAAELLGNPIVTEYQRYWLGMHAFYSGDWEVARERFNAGHALAQQLQHPALR